MHAVPSACRNSAISNYEFSLVRPRKKKKKIGKLKNPRIGATFDAELLGNAKQSVRFSYEKSFSATLTLAAIAYRDSTCVREERERESIGEIKDKSPGEKYGNGDLVSERGEERGRGRKDEVSR